MPMNSNLMEFRSVSGGSHSFDGGRDGTVSIGRAALFVDFPGLDVRDRCDARPPPVTLTSPRLQPGLPLHAMLPKTPWLGERCGPEVARAQSSRRVGVHRQCSSQ